jgi:hypothetical protein
MASGTLALTTDDMPRIKSAPLNLRVRPELKQALEQLAKADRRSLSSYLELALEEHVERAGKARAEAKPTGTKT